MKGRGAISAAFLVAVSVSACGSQPSAGEGARDPASRVSIETHPPFPHGDPEDYGVTDGHFETTREQAAIDHWAFCVEDRWGREMAFEDAEYQRIDTECQAEAGL